MDFGGLELGVAPAFNPCFTKGQSLVQVALTDGKKKLRKRKPGI